jgi:hypothetical protein
MYLNVAADVPDDAEPALAHAPRALERVHELRRAHQPREARLPADAVQEQREERRDARVELGAEGLRRGVVGLAGVGLAGRADEVLVRLRVYEVYLLGRGKSDV